MTTSTAKPLETSSSGKTIVLTILIMHNLLTIKYLYDRIYISKYYYNIIGPRIWKWTDGTPLDYQYWYNGSNCVQPDLAPTFMNNYCGHIWYCHNDFCGPTKGTWDDTPCTAVCGYAICQQRKGRLVNVFE